MRKCADLHGSLYVHTKLEKGEAATPEKIINNGVKLILLSKVNCGFANQYKDFL